MLGALYVAFYFFLLCFLKRSLLVLSSKSLRDNYCGVIAANQRIMEARVGVIDARGKARSALVSAAKSCIAYGPVKKLADCTDICLAYNGSIVCPLKHFPLVLLRLLVSNE